MPQTGLKKTLNKSINQTTLESNKAHLNQICCNQFHKKLLATFCAKYSLTYRLLEIKLLYFAMSDLFEEFFSTYSCTQLNVSG